MATGKPVGCCVCDVRLTSIQSIIAHFCGKKHNGEIWKNKVDYPGIYVADIENIPLEALFSHFVTQGSIQTTVLTRAKAGVVTVANPINTYKGAHIMFRTKEEVDAILTAERPHKIGGRFLNIYASDFKSRQRTQTPDLPTTDPPKVSLKEVEEALLNIGDPEEQMDVLVRFLEIPGQEMMQRTQIATHIQESARRVFQNCSVSLFGSTVNGLGFRGCDIDAFVETGLAQCKVDEDGIQLASLSHSEQKKAVKEISVLLRNMKSYIAAVVCIPKARVPIVKFVHVPTGLSCDLSFKNRMAVMNTEYIRLCVETDSRVRPVMVAIRYWASVYELSGGGKGGRTWKITNYALTMLIIFYLQIKGILHSAKVLQDYVAVGDGIKIDDWECNYCKDLTQLPQLSPTKNLSIIELLNGFFDFYANFDYAGQVVSPYAGEIMDKTDFELENKGTEDVNLTRYWRNVANGEKTLFPTDSLLCVQDPFELNICCTKGYSEAALQRWVKYCEDTHKITAQLVSPAPEAKAKNLDLLGIFQLPKIEVPGAKEREEKRKVKLAPSNVDFDGTNFRFEIAPEFGASLKDDLFVVKVETLIPKILGDVLKMRLEAVNATNADPCSKCSVLEAEGPKTDPQTSLMSGLGFSLDDSAENDNDNPVAPSPNSEQRKRKLSEDILPEEKRVKTNGEKSVPKSNKIWRSSVFYPVWDNRKSIRKKLGITEMTMKGEKMVSQVIADRHEEIFPAFEGLGPELTFDFGVHVLTGSRVCCHLAVVQSRKKVARNVLNFLAEYLKRVSPHFLGASTTND